MFKVTNNGKLTKFVSLLRQEDAYKSYQTMAGRTVTDHPDGLDAKPVKQFNFFLNLLIIYIFLISLGLSWRLSCGLFSVSSST